MKFMSLNMLLGLIINCFYYCSDSQHPMLGDKSTKIIIESQLLTGDNERFISNPFIKNVSEIYSVPLNYIELRPEWTLQKPEFLLGSMKWVFYSNTPLLLRTAFMRSGIYVNPGDSVHIGFNKNGLDYSGKGYLGIKLQNELEKTSKQLISIKPSRAYVSIDSSADYFKWKIYLDKKLELLLAILDSYKDKVTLNIFEEIKANAICNIERERAESFISLTKFLEGKDTLGLTPANLIAIYDTTINNKWAKWLQSRTQYQGGFWYFYQLNKLRVARNFNFDYSHDSINAESKRKMIYYNSLKQNYQGLIRERLLQYFVAEDIIVKLGFDDPIAKVILQDYYSQPGLPEYKKWMKGYEENMRAKHKGGKKIS